MAAATLTSQRWNVDGSYREKFFVITAANTNTLVTGMKVIKAVSYNDGAITKAAVSGGTITFSVTGTATGALIRVEGL